MRGLERFQRWLIDFLPAHEDVVFCRTHRGDKCFVIEVGELLQAVEQSAIGYQPLWDDAVRRSADDNEENVLREWPFIGGLNGDQLQIAPGNELLCSVR